MRRIRIPILVLYSLTLLVACGADLTPGDGNSVEWQQVLQRKKIADSAAATATEKQAYADALSAYVQKHPRHSRAREVFQHLEIDFAGRLAALGRHRDALRFYRHILAHDPSNAAALEGVRAAVEHLAVSQGKLLLLAKGMSQDDVAKILGKPMPGWIVKTDRREAPVEAWYYRKSDGSVAAIHFREGRLFAAEQSSQAKLVPLVAADR
ncbi:MAG TPA: hypothetical protein VEZ11_09205 [Thermoanaerobaculia bacterium]|nr:hypothetical protein [Thermoanaerobaculia bacterium]